jgi:hypothetical protein
MTRSAFKLVLVSSILACLVGQAAAESLGLSDIGAISCGLFLRYTGTNAPDYPVFNAFAQGYLVARTSGAKGEHSDQDLATLMSAVTQQCRDHPDDGFGSVLASVVTSELAKR